MTGVPFSAACVLCICFFPHLSQSGQSSPQPESDIKKEANQASEPLPENVLAILGSGNFRQGSSVTQLAGSPDGKWLVSAGLDGSIWLWDTASGKGRRLGSGMGSVSALAFSPNSQFVGCLSGFANPSLAGITGTYGQLLVWDVADSKNAILLTTQVANNVLALSPDGKLAAIDGGEQVKLVHLKKNQPVPKDGLPNPNPPVVGFVSPPLNRILALHFTDDGKHVISAGSDGQVQKLEVAGEKVVQTWEKARGTLFVQDQSTTFCPVSKQIAAVMNTKQVLVWGGQADQAPVQLPEASRRLGAAAFSPDGKLVAAVAEDKLQQLLNTPFQFGKPVQQVDQGPKESIFVWNVQTGKLLYRLGAKLAEAQSLWFAADGKTLFTGHYDGFIHSWDVQTGQYQPHKSTGHEEKVTALVYSSDGKYLLSAGADKTIRKWEAKTGKLLWTVAADVDDLALSPDGKTFAVAGPGKDLRLWQTSDGKALPSLKGHPANVMDVAYSPDGKYLASRCTNHVLCLWQADTGKVIYQVNLVKNIDGKEDPDGLPGIPGKPAGLIGKGLLFAPDGKHLFAVTNMGKIEMREAATGKMVRSIFTYNPVTALSISWDSKSLVVSNGSASAWLYEISTGQLRSKLPGQPGYSAFGQFGGMGPLHPSMHFAGFAGMGGFQIGGGAGMGFSGIGFTGNFSGNLTGIGFTGNISGYTFNIDQFNDSMLQLSGSPGHAGPIHALTFSTKGKQIVTAGYDGTLLIWDSMKAKVLHRLDEHRGPVACLVFSPDGKTLASAGADTRIILWDVPGLLAKKTSRAEKCWEELAIPSAPMAFRAMQELAEQPEQALAVLKKNLSPATLPSPQIQKWLADLDSKHFATREKAVRELEKIAETIEPALRALLEKPPSLEAHLRVKLLVEKIPRDNPSATRLQQTRALELLEQLDTPAARQLLQALANGTPEAWLTQEAKKSLTRLTE